ncbi:nucleoside transporter [Xylogone sp. PMI_703]|nr:nucleoside transporter [Xylogone sp. PMI_703]
MELMKKSISKNTSNIEEGHNFNPEDPPPEIGEYFGHGELEVIKIREGNSVLRKLRAAEMWMDRKLKIESMGAERIPEDERRPPQILNMMFFWFSMLVSPGLITMGVIGPILGLSVNVSIILSVFAACIGSVIPAFTATLCAPLGLRQIAASRYAFGIWGSKFCGLLNIIVNIGFGTINCIVAGQLLSAVSGGSLTLVIGIVVVCVGSFIISFLGFRWIQRYESIAWFLIFIFLCIEFGQSARYFSPTPGLSYVSGLDKSGAALTYFSIVFGESAAWCSMTGDYYVHYPPKINKWLVFWMTWAGLTLPTVFVLILGNYYGGIIQTNEALSKIYDDGGIGALILATMRPSGWAKFVCVMYALSFIATVTAIIYSSSLSIQLWGKHFLAVPRFIWNILLGAISLGLAWGGQDSLESILLNFLSLLGYWTICFGVILAIETFYFRPQIGGYDVEGWQDQNRMPWGLAGCGSLALGIGCSFLGMDQTWFVGPVAKLIGNGGDVGDYFTLIAVLVSYPFLRRLELKYIGR